MKYYRLKEAGLSELVFSWIDSLKSLWNSTKNSKESTETPSRQYTLTLSSLIDWLLYQINIRLETLKNSDVGYDSISAQGYYNLLTQIDGNRLDIQTGTPESNVLWTILGNNIKYFSDMEARILIGLFQEFFSRAETINS